MIFVTVGTQLPFDRLIRTIDEWASRRHGADVFAQIGPSDYQPKHIQWTRFLGAEACREKTLAADLIVAHAGMGSIITALELGKPILVMPRRAALGEHRNDHQLATVSQLASQGKVTAAMDEAELLEKLDHIELIHSRAPISNRARPELLNALRAFVDGPSGLGMTDEALENVKRAKVHDPVG